MRLLPVNLLDDEVRKSISRVRERSKERWSVEFVIQSIEAGNSGLFHFWDDGHIAFMVVEKYSQGDRPWMNVWILEGAGLDRIKDALPLIDGLARSIGCVAWRATGRKGWGRWLKPIATVYEREIL